MTAAMAGKLAEAVGMGLFHFTWIGLALGALVGLALHGLRGRNPGLRYGAALSGFAVLACVPFGTIYVSFAAIDWSAVAPGGFASTALTWPASSAPAMPSTRHTIPAERADRANVGPHSGARTQVTPPQPRSPAPRQILVVKTLSAMAPPVATLGQARVIHQWRNWASARVRIAAPWLAGAWVIGVLILGLRLLGGLHYTRTLRRRGTAPLDRRWQARLEPLRERAGIRRGVRVFQSTLAGVPVVVGWLRPVVLMPAAVLTGLEARQVELLLAHELAHVKRLDPLVNLLQVLVETLLFFHPIVWWLSRRIREERELCCDDFALALCGGRADYARALLRLAEVSVVEPPLALAARGGALQRRIHRILGLPGACERLSAPGALGLALLTLCGALVTGLAWAEIARGGNTPDTRADGSRAGAVEMQAQDSEVTPVPDEERAARRAYGSDNPALQALFSKAFAALADAGTDFQIARFLPDVNASTAPGDGQPGATSATTGEDAEQLLTLATDAPTTGAPARRDAKDAPPAADGGVQSAIYALESQLIDTMTTLDFEVRSQPIPGAAPGSEAPGVETIDSPEAAAVPEVEIARAEAPSDTPVSQREVEVDAEPLPESESAPPAREGAEAPYPQGDPETVERLQQGRSNVQYVGALEGTHISQELSMLRLATGIRFLLDARTVAPPAQGFRGDDAQLGTGYATDGVLPVTSVREGVTPEAWLKELTVPLGLSYLVYPDTVIISTPERLAEIAAIYRPRFHGINARYYRVSDPELVARLEAHLDAAQGAAAFPAEELLPDAGPEPWTALEQRTGVSLLANHAATAADDSSWWHDDPADSRDGDAMSEPHRLYKFGETERRDHAGCGGNLAGFGPPIMFYDTALPSARAPIGAGIQALAHHAAPILFSQIVDLNPPRPKVAERRTGGRRAEKGEGQDRPERSKWFDASGIAAAFAVRATGDADRPAVHACIQQNLFQWDLARRGEWQTLECAGRFMSPTYVYAWPTSEAGTYAMAVVHVERAGDGSAGPGLQTARADGD